MPDNALGQPIGESIGDWQAPPSPPHVAMDGHYVRLEPLDVAGHGEALFSACCSPDNDAGWTYLPVGPFAEREAYVQWLGSCAKSSDPLFFAVIDRASGKAQGVASYLRIAPEAGSIEVGNIHFGPAMRGQALATEAMMLMMANAFDLGYRRYEWKCDALNAPSRRAAARLGFAFEGIFRQAIVYKRRNRDTAWFAVIDREWPALKQAFERWLAPENFDAQGRQKLSLSAMTASLRAR